MRASGVWRLLERARRVNLAADGEAAPTAGLEGQSRRALLQALVAAAGAGPLAAKAAVRPGSGPVVIVGGGMAGLAALWRLTQAGVDARLYEARARLGGRMYTARTPGAAALEMGGQLVNSDHGDIRRLAKVLGVGLIDRKAAPHRTLLFAGGRVIPEAEAVAGLRAIAAQIGADADRLDKDLAHAGPMLDVMSFTGYLDLHAKLMPQPWVRGLLENTARTEYGVEPGQASAIELIWNLPTVKGKRLEVLGASDERYVIENGSGALIDALAARLAKKIITGRSVVALEQDGGGGGVRVHLSDQTVVAASQVIVATPAGVTRRIQFDQALPGLWRSFINEVALGRNEKVHATMTSRPWEAALGQGGEIWRTGNDGVAEGWDGSVRPLAGKGATWTWFLGGDQVAAAAGQAPDAVARRFASGVEAGVPGMAAAVAGARMTAWHSDPLTAGSYVNFNRGQVTKFARVLWVENEGKVAVPPLSAGAIHFAGEHLSDAYPGYMNGAAQTGRLAAEAVIASLRRA